MTQGRRWRTGADVLNLDNTVRSEWANSVKVGNLNRRSWRAMRLNSAP
ncbi:hypothetical protein KCP73_08370 [Salmonella enterica subsp. enterica]|nr:hypothetical protein KCP73_08370 [Salmonella enterica subsp. enterica]